MRRWLRSLNPQLPRAVQLLQLGGLANAFGNGAILPFVLIYLHNVQGIGLGTAGLVLATNAFVSIGAGPVAGTLVDRIGGKRVLASALVFLAVGYAGYVLVDSAWKGFVAASVTGIGNGLFWPAQSTLITVLTPRARRHAAFAMQRVVMNLGIGLGALVGGLIATTSRPVTFDVLFLVNGATFVVYLAVLALLVPEPSTAASRHSARGGSYAPVVRDRPFMGVVALNTLFIFAGMAGFELLPVYAKNEAAVTETMIGVVFFVNTVVIVLAQLPVTKLSEGHRRMRTLALLGVLWAGCWVLVPLAGSWVTGAAAAVLLAGIMAAFGIGECLHGAVQGPLVADLAEPSLIGRYMALSALSWQVGFALGPALGGFALDASPTGTWFAAAAICLLAGAASLALERSLPQGARTTPVPQAA
jgi:MFS family permease